MMATSKDFVEGEVPVTKEDKEKILSLWNEIRATLDKYPYRSCPTTYVTTMSRVKSTASHFSEWVKLLHVKE